MDQTGYKSISVPPFVEDGNVVSGNKGVVQRVTAIVMVDVLADEETDTSGPIKNE